MLVVPLGVAGAGMELAQKLGWQKGAERAARTIVYRFSFPAIAGLAAMFWAFGVVGAVVKKWRASVRDEVYLVGERLHNFGEFRPPVGSRSVVRKEK
jgi:E3 ubiquitin-protein ligase MARCH6